MTSLPGLLSMNRISTRCQVNSSLYINADCNRFVQVAFFNCS